MSLRPIGGIFARLDASGNLTFYDASGNVIAKFLSGKLSTTRNSFSTVSAGGQTTTNTAGGVSSGIGGTLTPQVSTTILITVTVTGSNNTAADGWYVYACMNTTGIPSNGTAIGSDTILGGQAIGGTLSNTVGNILISGGAITATGLTLSTAYYFYIGFKANTGGTASIGSAVITGTEG